MRFATVEEPDGAVRCGVVVDDVLHRLPPGTRILDLLRTDTLLEVGRSALSARDTVSLTEVRLLPPLEAPTVRDFVAFEEHVEGVRRSVEGEAGVVPEWYEAPAFYFTNPHSLIGAHDEVAVPPGCAVLDYELEVAAIIGREGADLTPAQARSHIAGYTIFNDWSARDLQSREMRVGLGPAKGKDFAGTLGPVLVTADELEPYRDADGFLHLAMTASVNATEVGRDLLSNMGWPFEELLAHAARGSRVRPGDVLGSGTCGHGGCLAELWGRRGVQQPPPLRPGDVVEMTVEGIGVIANTVVEGVVDTDVPPVRPARRRDRQRP
ncbi:fumarylacetoacetate hydrolase family protein [Haloactinomyces albus]|uniref:2-keto-4-pentenoate hydratase/2-oxohepta-3-ene-1,7-dioic acid hydratase in catechol pathway n=1 Tax=Haloactinomyces albus TaxID=1352928 RepID=A0AAE3ZJ61_9ACTN|nr:fumarylacetoacetate hydrolase family protein [Haloactinomyces albus]MDR7304598.1 2-keto-4-pentenoate hydratase/2-oxohepta-3-ene-1,7-dioic acid hydratase in catechol pathway [Haloactinomyces albus]